MGIIKLLASLILPPLGVYLKVGVCGTFWLNILLTILGYLPGVIHAFFVLISNKGSNDV
ncbi:Uncharacterized membrane protein YqaE, homolog of Blt101, UPF0057 family [Marisediminitalea aggregata]|jgi:uncharacterized membrane protein YqaE (UPF0057 family)|uniref:Uncharacterized membrane protein YqaE, homolog of Blt101, UPF0057 family n=1 Tax=Marisediminitalea aggregata TaxID=634436 RepID=A0A1M5J0F1_9ALTE|nr:YqaE/Pmp3 family membrane protein [Marisediminitalea aggregata]MAP21060.1 YqaE/Pmp3 family membrane protein [Alteromonadaceae bacterium]MCP4275621.1 YqaE/Pmp3 family membrane protein [Gammaproteobacteria bacterium]MEC7470611.1 YqaE/Pmp3 family membrane protein [Pseudomonadota bacterium]HBY39159.1 YqaE/Pmp3 family membrane protein [Alteromonas sp.]MAX42464.1 YqaE/Pmp3 family membrane protein [Alteromonadaceae bacterium]|tara:strand:+ start:198 stop:374 length:177 start_codon:yes stop_codon:yes gene_type:complete